MLERLRQLRRRAVEQKEEYREVVGRDYVPNSYGSGHTAGYIDAIDEIIELVGGKCE